MNERRAVRPAGNLPSVPSSFVGRHEELIAIRRLLESSRLVTLTGPGGVGKTRLGLRAGHAVQRLFGDGVWLVDLSTVDDPARVAETFAASLDLQDLSARPTACRLADHLRDRSALLVVDNCEHLLDGCVPVVDRLLAAAPALRIIATSREQLGATGECVLQIPPLAVPDPDSLPPLDVATRYESVALLVDRAAAVRPDFRLQDSDVAVAARLCARLDGLPLAIELAATRLRSLSLEQLDARLEDRFRLLTLGARAAAPRQHTLRDLIDWSFQLCTEPERRLWAKLSVFPGGFDLEAVEAVCADEQLPAEDVVDVLDSLVAKSVVTARPVGGRMRYGMLETIRQYARGVYDQGERASLRRAHRSYYLRQALRWHTAWFGPDQPALFVRFQEEDENFAAAMDWSLATPGQEQAALQLVAALCFHWTVAGKVSAGRRRVEEALRATEEPSVARGHVLWNGAVFAQLQGDSATARRWAAECAEIAVSHDDELLRGYADLVRATGAFVADGLGRAVELFEAGIARMRAAGRPDAQLWGAFQLAVALSHLGRHERARAVCQEAIALATRLGETWARGEAIWALALDHWLAGDPTHDAEALAREALALTPGSNLISTVLDVELLAWIAASRGRHRDAAVALGAADGMWSALGIGIGGFGASLARHSAACHAACVEALGDAVTGTLLEHGRRHPSAVWEGRDSRVGDRSREVAHGLEELTPRQLQIARLIAEGMTNRAIAAKLVLSQRTVDGHVERVFSRLGVSKRAQLAAWMAEHNR